ncbi:hypothetical protein [Aliarcobacter butzleri]|uniref:hypothetical protein n=1 Tax=Aliarcobacter butzleri TaxID=28197 RepID=UPI0012607480|nr:hypothetical protein [Aliarcobacter butzleri]
MRSKDIAIEYLAPKINDPVMIFKDINIFKLILPWARDSAREYFETQISKMFLVPYIDDVAYIVDEYLIDRANKMYEKAMKSKNKLFNNLSSSKKTVAWIIDRWVNVFINLTTNKNYINHIDIKKIKVNFSDEISYYDSNIDDIIEFEKVKKIPKDELINIIKKVLKEGLYDDLDEQDIVYLCNNLNLKPEDVFKFGDFINVNFKKVQVGNGNFQLEFVI